MLIAKSQTHAKELERFSPSELADRFRAPVLLLHAQDDMVVKFSQALRMEKSLKRSGKAVKLITLNGEDHFLSKSATRLQTIEEEIAFVDQNLKRNKR